MRYPPFATAALLLVSSLAAQQTPTTPAPAPFTIPPGEMKLAQLVDMAARYLQANFVVADPQLLADPNPLTLTEPVITDRPGCVRALAAILATRGFGLLPLDPDHGIYEIVQAWGERGMELQFAAEFAPCEQLLADPHGKQMVTTVVPLQHVRTPALTAAMRPFFASNGPARLGAAVNGERLIVSGQRDSVAAVVHFAQANDAQAADAATRLADHVHALQEKVAALQARIAALQKEGK